MTEVAAPVIEAEMKDWTSKGGSNLGIEGNQDHDYGFHRAANKIPSSDYSRTNDPNGSDGPYTDWDYCCAGDFGHKNDSKLRKMHADVLNKLMDGKYPMICEFIGKPWADKPVYYWARWNGIDNLQKYTGSGHDTWSHISWYRSKANQRAYLWIPEDDVTISSDDAIKIFNTDNAIDSKGFPWRSDSLAHTPPGTNKGYQAETAITEAAQRANLAYEEAKKAVKLGEENAAVLAEIKEMISAGPMPQPVKWTLSGPVTFTPADGS
jgi:hypothetical protein